MESNKPLGYMLGRSLRVYKYQMASEFKKLGIELTFEQFVILNKLNSNSNVFQQDLAIYLQKDKSIIVRQIDELLEKEFVIRLTCDADKRKKNLILTPQGVEILNHLKGIASEVSKRLLSGVNETELEICLNVLTRIQQNGQADEEPFQC